MMLDERLTKAATEIDRFKAINAELLAALEALVYHDTAADERESRGLSVPLEGCIELQSARRAIAKAKT